MKRITKLGLRILLPGVAALLGFAGRASSGDVTYERLLNADKEPQNWLTYYGNYGGWRYSALDQINTTTVKRLVMKWVFQPGPDEGLQVTPIVVDGVMYLSNGRNQVFALDAATGKIQWRYSYKLPELEKMPTRIWSPGQNRGLVVANRKLLMGTNDAYLVALDAKTGNLLWKVQAGDYEAGEGFTSPPLIVKDKLITSVSTNEFPVRGHIDAYDLETGKRIWEFHTVPGPGEPGHETWGGDSWQYGCSSAWLP